MLAVHSTVVAPLFVQNTAGRFARKVALDFDGPNFRRTTFGHNYSTKKQDNSFAIVGESTIPLQIHQPIDQTFLTVQTVGGLVNDDTLFAIDDFGSNFFAAACW